MRRNRMGAVAVPAALVLALAAGCGSGEENGSGTEGEDGGLTPVTVGLIPIVDVAPLYLGESQGFFEEAGIDPTFEMAQGGAAIVAAVVSRDYDFGFSNIVSLMNAQSQGIDLRVVTAGSSSTGEPGADFGSILVPPGSDIDSVDDLSGRTIAINALQSMNDPLIRDAVERAGGDPDTVEFVEIGHPEMNQALEQGQVDAIWQVEPFHTMALDAGMVSIYSLYAEATEDLTVATYFASGALVDEDPELAAAFREAVNESFAYAAEHPEETREVMLDYTTIDPDVVDRLQLPAWPTTVNRDSIDFVTELAIGDGLFAEEDLDIDQLFPPEVQ